MLGGNPVLVLETEFIIALDLGARLQDMGAGHVVLAHDPDSARAQQQFWAGASLAVLEIQETRPSLLAFAAEVRASGTPVILVTTDAGLRPTQLAGAVPPLLLKPVAQEALEAAVLAALDLSASRPTDESI